MEIVLAESLGFCMGVKRVVDMAYRALDKANSLPVVTLGPLIHNTQEIARLSADGIAIAGETLPEKGTAIIRAHGVAPQAYEDLKARGLKIMDGTCPYVHYSQRKAVELQREGYQVVIVGDKSHPEIAGILGFVNNEAIVVKTVEDALALPQLGRVGTIAQTTLSPKKYQSIVDALRQRASEVKVCETICDATEENQSAIRDMSGEVDLIYVIGGRHSANSSKLAEVAREKCSRTILIETADEISPDDLRGATRIGISAGASTPDWMIRNVIQRLHEIEKSLANNC